MLRKILMSEEKKEILEKDRLFKRIVEQNEFKLAKNIIKECPHFLDELIDAKQYPIHKVAGSSHDEELFDILYSTNRNEIYKYAIEKESPSHYAARAGNICWFKWLRRQDGESLVYIKKLYCYQVLELAIESGLKSVSQENHKDIIKILLTDGILYFKFHAENIAIQELRLINEQIKKCENICRESIFKEDFNQAFQMLLEQFKKTMPICMKDLGAGSLEYYDVMKKGIDKTGLIEYILNDHRVFPTKRNFVFIWPPGYGKKINLQMLRNFF